MSHELDRTILIASNSSDARHVAPVTASLTKAGWKVIDYKADMVASGDIPLAILLDEPLGVSIFYDNAAIQPSRVSAAWSRRPTSFGPHLDTEDRATRISIDYERAASQQLLWDMVPDNRWLNAPDSMRRASHKMSQLVLARQVGLTTPETVVSNQWAPIIDRLPDDVVYKSFHGSLYEGTTEKIVFTTPFSGDRMASSQGELFPYPGIWQEAIPKQREWRLTLVGDDSFDAVVETDEDARDDWRLHQTTPKVRFERGQFPDEDKEKCFALLGHMGLRFSTFDFVERPDGGLVFLEINPNGQYQWLEDELGLPISKAVATELMRIAGAGS